MHAKQKRMEEFLSHLTTNIGVRLAGTREDALAVEYIVDFLARSGISSRVETYPVLSRQVGKQLLELEIDGQWKQYPCSLFSSVPGTNGKTLEGEVVFFAGVVDYQRQDLSFLKDKAVVHLGCHIESRENYSRLIQADPAFLLFVDIRHPGDVPLADGMFPAYTKDLGAKPTLNVAFKDAWEWQQKNATRARIAIEGGMVPSQSSNVVIDLPGSDPAAGWLYVGAHHDTQADTVGADDDGSGTTVILEMATLLKDRPRKRGVRLIAFGAEEQLSVGSASYIRQHREEIEKEGQFMLNFDSCGAAMGWYKINGNGPKEMFALIQQAFHKRDRYPGISEEVVPYTDQFPFAICGVPGVWVHRECCSSGRVWHHRFDDDLRHISFKELALACEAGAEIIQRLANSEKMPFAREINAEQKSKLLNQWKDLYGGW